MKEALPRYVPRHRGKLQGVLGSGPFEWVDRRVFDQVFDRLTLLSVYKLMTSGAVDTLDHPIARARKPTFSMGRTLMGAPWR